MSRYRLAILSAWLKLNQSHPGRATKVYRRFGRTIDQAEAWVDAQPLKR